MKKILLSFIVVLCVLFIGCPDGKNKGGPITAKFVFTDTNSLPSNNQNIRAVNTMNGNGYKVNESDFEQLNAFYDSLGNKKGAYTPTEFKLFLGAFTLYNTERIINFFLYGDGREAEKMIDFANPVVIESKYPVTPGTYTGMVFQYEKVVGAGQTSITFTVPDGVGAGHRFEKTYGNLVIVSGNTYTIDSNFVSLNHPASLSYKYATDMNPVLAFSDHFLTFYSDTYRLITNKTPINNRDWLITELGQHQDDFDLPSEFHPNEGWLVIPYDAVTIPDDAAAVKFTLYWDLENIIERYEGDTEADSDDIYILAKGYWDRILLTTEIEY